MGVLVGSGQVSGGRGRRAAKGGRRPALHSTTLASNDDGWLPMAVVEVAHGETWSISRLVKLQVYDNGPMDPWPLHRDHWLNWLRISDMEKCQGGTRWGRAAPRWHQAVLACGPRWPCHVHLLPWSMFVTILAKICHISYIQIILQAQVELGEI
jgi:hypothetical protein